MTSNPARRPVLLGLSCLLCLWSAIAHTQEQMGCITALQDYRVAIQSYNDGLFDPAMAGFTAYLQQCPDSEQATQAHYLVGHMLYKRQRYVDALAHANHVIAAQAPSTIRPQALLLAAQCARQLGQIDQAKRYLHDMLTSKTTSELLQAAWYWLGEIAFEQQRHDEALSYYNRVVHVQPAGVYTAYAHYALGWLYRRQQNVSAALAAFTALIALDPTHEFAMQARFARAELLREANQLSEAHEAFQQLAKDAPIELRDEALFWWAETAYQLGRFAEAGTRYHRLVAEYPQSARVHASLYGWGWAALQQQRCAEAVQPWETLLKRDAAFPQVLEVHYRLGLCYLQLEQVALGRQHLQHVVEAGQEVAYSRDARLKLASLALQEQAYEEAIRYYKSALATATPEDTARLYYLLGESYAASGDVTQAIEHWQQIIARMPTDPLRAQALFRLGSAYVAQKAWPEVISTLGQLWNEYPEFPERTAVAAHLVQAYRSTQRCVEAVPFYDRIIAVAHDARQRQGAVAAKALCLFEAGRYLEVVEQLTPMLEVAVEPHILYLLGQAHLHLQQDHDALRPFVLLRQSFPDHDLTITAEPLLAKAFERTGDHAEALAVWEAFLQRGTPQEEHTAATLRLHVGRIAVKHEHFAQALGFLAPVRQTAVPELAAEALFWSGEAYRQQQQWELALQVYQELLDRYAALQDWSMLARLRMGLIYEHQQDWERALRTYQVLLSMTTDENIRATVHQRITAIEAGQVLQPQPPSRFPSKG